MKYVYTEEQVNTLFNYLMKKPMLEAEGLVAILRSGTPLEEKEATKSENKEKTPEKE